MKRRKRAIAFENMLPLPVLLFLFALLAVSCQAQTVNAPVVESALPVVAAQPTAVQEATAPTSLTNPSEVTQTLVVETAVVDECLACHIDKEQLIATADPEEEVIKESEGAG